MRLFLILFFSILFLKVAFGQTTISRDIAVKVTPYTNCNIYLASYFGNGRIMADTAWLNEKSEGAFKGKRKLTSGMYFILSPKNVVLFELMLDSAQNFSIAADTSKLNSVVITGSPENTLFKQYIQGLSSKITQINTLAQQIRTTKTKADTLLVQQKQTALAKSLQDYKDSTISVAPHSLLSLFLTAGKQPENPSGMTIKTKADTIKAALYIKKHYWDGVPFNDDRLLYTPFFEPKIDNYFKRYVSPVADSVIKEIQYMLLYARTGKEMYPYLLSKFTNRYLNPDHIGQNKVFLYLFNDFFMRGDTILLSPQSKKIIFDRAYALLANQVGEPAPPLNLTTADGKTASLYNLQSAYTLLVFWDPSCSHCQQQLPRIDSIYKAKWKALGVKLYSVNINAALMHDVAKFALAKNLSADWIHTYQTDAAAKLIVDSGQLNYYQLYDIVETPSLYLLDAQKHIIAKHLSIEQFDKLLDINAMCQK